MLNDIFHTLTSAWKMSLAQILIDSSPVRAHSRTGEEERSQAVGSSGSGALAFRYRKIFLFSQSWTDHRYHHH